MPNLNLASRIARLVGRSEDQDAVRTPALSEVVGEVWGAVQQRLDRARAHFEGLDEDSYASRNEGRAKVTFLANFRAQLDGADVGKRIDLSTTVVDYGYDPEAAAADRSCGLEYEPEVDRLESEHESHIRSVLDLVDRLQAAGVETDTSFRVDQPLEHEDEPVVMMTGRDWWEDQRASILASDIPADEAARELADLGPEPPEGFVAVGEDGREVYRCKTLEADPIGVERTAIEEQQHEVGPLSQVDEREQTQQLGLEL